MPDLTVESVEALTEVIAAFLSEVCSGVVGWRDRDPVEVALANVVLNSGVISLAAEVKAEALQQAADDWLLGQWADAPRTDSLIQERIANARFVARWLRERARLEDPRTDSGETH